jgi:hypothetical protein
MQHPYFRAVACAASPAAAHWRGILKLLDGRFGGKPGKPLQSERKNSGKWRVINKTPPNFRSIWSGGH